MSAWTQLIEPGPALLILVLALTPQLGYAAPSALEYSDQSTEIEYYPVADATGCYYNFEHYDEGDRIITNEPCLNCTCHNRMLMCYLRVCPFTKAIGQNCKVEKKADQCCPVITCPEVHVQLLPHGSTTPSTQLGHPNEYGCTIDSLFYADGAKVPSNPNNPCEVCYCIRNKTACIIQDCTLTGKVVEGCHPVYVDGVCCPVRYDCDHPEIETTPRPLLTTTTTTLPPTSAPTDCIYNNEVYSDGALVKKDVPCEQCYCMRGDIICAVQECGPTPLDKVNCTALPPKEGQCCPDTYECENLSEEDLTTLSYYEVPTTLPSVKDYEDGVTTKAPIPQITLADDQLSAETEGRVSASTTEISGDHTITEGSTVTESAITEAVTSKFSEAVEAVTSKVTEIIEAVTSTIMGTEKDTTSSPETITEGGEVASEATTIEVVTDKSEEITEKLAEGQQPVTEYEEQTDHGVIVTESVVQETQTPESDDQKLATTTPEKIEHILPVTTELTEQEVVTEVSEPVAHDDHEETDQEELPHEDENEVTEGSGTPIEKQEPDTTKAPELDSEDKHTRPIDQSEVEEKRYTTQQPEIETTHPPIKQILPEDENQITEGSGAGEQGPIGTLAPESETTDHGLVTEQPEIKLTQEAEGLSPTTEIPMEPESVTGTLSTDKSVEDHTKTFPEQSVTSEPITPLGTELPEEQIPPEHCVGDVCQQTIQPNEPALTTVKPESEISVIPEVETTITEQEEPHANVTKQPEESSVTEETETKLPKEITTTENIIPESSKPGISLEEETVSEPKETTTKVSSILEPTPEEKKPSEEVLPEKPSATEAGPITETQKPDIEVSHEEEKPSFDGTEEEGDHDVTTEKEEIQFVTEIPTAETKKPQSMDHVFETISPESTSAKTDSEVHETEKPVENQTTDQNIYTTELPKSSETILPGAIKPEPENPVEAVTELPENEMQVTTERISGVTEAVSDISATPVTCDNAHGCASEQEKLDKIPEVIESCTKENCAPQGEVPQSEDGKETGVVPESPTSCDSEHDCVPTMEKEGTDINNGPEKVIPIECSTKNGCPSPGSEKEGHIPEIAVTEKCDSEDGCALAVSEKEINQTTESNKLDGSGISEPCSNETSCTPEVPEKTEVHETESEEKIKLPESTTTSDEITQKITPLYEEGSEQPPTVSEDTEKPEEIEGSGQDIEGSGQKPEETQHTVEPGESIEGSGQITTEVIKSELTTEEGIIRGNEPSEQDITKATPSLPVEETEKSTDGKQIVTVTSIAPDEENEIEPDSTSGPEQTEDKNQTPGVILSEGTESPEGTQTPEIFTQQGIQISEVTEHEGTESPEQVTQGVTKATYDTATEGVIPEVPVYVAPETTQTPEKPGTIISEITSSTPEDIGNELSPESTLTPEHIEPEGTQSSYEKPEKSETIIPEIISSTPEDIENELFPESTITPEHIEPEGTQSSYENIPVSTVTSEKEENADTQSPEKDLSNVTEIPEKNIPEGTQYPENIIPHGTQLPEEVSKSTQVHEETTDSTTSGSAIPEVTESPEEISPEDILKPDQAITEATDSVQQTPSESTKIPADTVPENTEIPEQIDTETTEPSKDNIPQTTHHIQDISTSTQLPEESFEGTQATVEFEGTQGPKENISKPDDEIPKGTQVPETYEGTVSTVDLGIGETKTPEGTQTAEQIISETTYAPENIPHEKVTQSTEQIASETTHAPEDTKYSEPEISQSTQSPEEISKSTDVPEITLPETSQATDSKVPEIESTETSKTTEPSEEPAPKGTQLPERDSTTDIPKFSDTSKTPLPTESEIGEEEEHGIPGEGNCLVDGQTYKNNSNVPPINQCKTSCRCISSILQCESVSCPPPPNNLQDCMPIFHSHDSCCPIYTCTVPGVTSMESDSHVLETTTTVQVEDKPVTIGIQIIPSDVVTEKSTGVSISSEETTTTKHIEEEIGTTEGIDVIITETPSVPVQPTTQKSVEEETTKLNISEPLTTEKAESETEKLSEVDTHTEGPAVEAVTKEVTAPESKTSTPGAEITDGLTETEIVPTEPSAMPTEGEKYPEENEIETEGPIVPEHCGVEGCKVPVLPTEKSQLPEKSVTEKDDEEIGHTVSNIEEEITEKQEESYTDKPKVEPTETTQTEKTEPLKESGISTSEISTATEQIVSDELATEHIIPSKETSTDKNLLQPQGSTVTEQPEEEAYTVETEAPKISETTLPESDYTKLPESVTEAIVEHKPSDKEHIPSETETPVTDKIRGEMSTESEETSESATEAISQETKSPEEIAAIPEMEEAFTYSSKIPESGTETMIEATSPLEKLPEKVETEQPITEVIPESELPVKPEVTTEIQEPSVETEVTEGGPAHDEGQQTESQPEIRYPDRVSTVKPEYDTHTTESHETLQTTSSILEHVTEINESITPRPIETADHVTEVVEKENEETVTPIIEVSSESTSKQSVEEPAEVTDVVITESVPQEESKPEEKPVTESHITTLPTLEEETGTDTKSEKDKPSTSEFTTISVEIDEATQPTQTEEEGPIISATEGGIPIEKEQEETATEKEKDITQPEEGEFPTHALIDKATDSDLIPPVTTPVTEKVTATVAYVITETPTEGTVKSETDATIPIEKDEEIYLSPELITQAPNISAPFTSVFEELSTKKSVPGELSTSATIAATVSPVKPSTAAPTYAPVEPSTAAPAYAPVEPSTAAPTYAPPPVPGHEIPGEHIPDIPDYQSPPDDYEDEDQSPLGPGTCRYGGKVYVSAQQIPRDDPCDFCFCFRSDIICLQQSCPPPIPRCHEEPIRGFCCPRYECPVGMAMSVNVTTSTTTTTTTLPPHFLSHAYQGRVTRSGCQIKGRAYQVGAEITSASGPCLHCTCGGDGEMKCDPKACSPEPMLRQMIAAAASRRRR